MCIQRPVLVSRADNRRNRRRAVDDGPRQAHVVDGGVV